MVAEEKQEKEFVIPTKYKTPIGSYLSWPVGAVELTKAFLGVPQIKEMQLEFYEDFRKYPKGKWPASFRVIRVRYAYHRTQYNRIAGVNDARWYLQISPVPREMRAEIREAFKLSGFRIITEWLIGHAKFNGREGNLLFSGIWNSESKELTFGTQDNVSPEVSAGKHRNKE